jgi:hypothetical protein
MEAIVNVSAVRTESRNFYVWMAGIFLLVAFGGFTPTYWAKIASGSFHAEPIIHIHGILLFSWTCFYFVQTALVASGRTLDHRAWGLAGISLFTAMMFSILAGQEAVLHRNELLGFGDGARRFAAVTLTAWPLMAAMFTLAIVNIRKPEVHKRLMTLLMIAMMTPALARVFLTLLAPPGRRRGRAAAGVRFPAAGAGRGSVADHGHRSRLAHARPTSPGLCLWWAGPGSATGADGAVRRDRDMDAYREGIPELGGIARAGELLSRPLGSPARRRRPCAKSGACD